MTIIHLKTFLPTKAKVVASAKKVMLTVFYDSRGIVAWHLLPESIKTINSVEYIATIKFMIRRIKKKRPEYLENGIF